ncbi:MAG: ABC transporter substrate-binding protein [Bacteroidota bacterium]
MKKNLLLALFTAGLLLIFTGCGSEENGGGETTTTNDSTSSGEPVFGDWIRVHTPSDPDALHPYATTHGSANMIKELMFQYLYDFDIDTKQMTPVLAKDYAIVSEDGLAFTFEMRDEATWDDGSPITGYDYAFSVKCILNPISESPHLRGYYSFITEVQVDPNNERRFTVLTEEPFFLSEFAVAGFEIISKEFYDPDGRLDNITIAQLRDDSLIADNPYLTAFNKAFHDEKFKRDPEGIYGSGPYRFVNWTTGDNITLERKKEWWGYKVPKKGWPFEAYADKVIFKSIPDRSTALRAAQAGEIDVIRDVPGDEFTKYIEEKDHPINQDFALHRPQSYTYVYLGLNACPPPGRTPVLADKKVRRALAHLTNVNQIIETVYNGYGQPIVGPISPLNVNEYNDNLKPVPFDIDKAKSLLDEAGWTDSDADGVRDKVIGGKKVPLEIEFMISSSSQTAPSMAAILTNEAKKAGVRINVVKKEFSKLTEQLKSHNFDMFGAAFNGSPLPKDLKQVWHTDSWVNRGSNYTCFGNAHTDSLIMQIRVTLNPDDRKPLYHEIQEIIQDEQPMIFLMAPEERMIIHKRFANVNTSSIRPGFKVQQFWTPAEKRKFDAN